MVAGLARHITKTPTATDIPVSFSNNVICSFAEGKAVLIDTTIIVNQTHTFALNGYE